MLALLVPLAVLSSIPSCPLQSELPPDIQAALDEWRVDHGTSWQVFLDEETQMGRLLFNGSATYTPIDPRNDAERFLLTRAFLEKAYGIFGLDDDTLVDDRVKFLPLGMIGTTDKRTVRLRQFVAGIEVVGGSVNALFDDDDNLLSIDSQALPYLNGFDVIPNVDPNDAAAAAAAAFLQDTGLTAEVLGTPELRIFQHWANGLRAGALAWEVQTAAEDAAGETVAYLYRVAAKSPMSVMDREDLVFNAFPCQQQPGSIKVKVLANVTWGDDGDPMLDKDWLPPAADTLEIRPMPYMTVWRVLPDESKAVIATTDANGEFSLPSSLDGITVEVDFTGTYAEICNMKSGEKNVCTPCENAPVSQVLHVGLNTIFMNPGEYNEIRVAQANAYYYLNYMRDWIRAVDPTDSTLDDGPDPEDVNPLPGIEHIPPYTVRPNYTGDPDVPVCSYAQFQSRCSVLFGGGPIYDLLLFTRNLLSDPGCPNTAFSTVIFHEMGHWLNVLYGNGNRQPFGEGNADAWALYLSDFHLVSRSNMQRDGENDVWFCGDCPPGPDPCTACQECHGGAIHFEGQVLMGALWKVRKRLEQDPILGHDLGAAIANSLFLAWMNAFDTDRILSVIEYQWLVLDAGADGILANAPHLSQIDCGFLDQQFPGFQTPPFRYSCDAP